MRERRVGGEMERCAQGGLYARFIRSSGRDTAAKEVTKGEVEPPSKDEQ
jgi:hypothetical protein